MQAHPQAAADSPAGAKVTKINRQLTIVICTVAQRPPNSQNSKSSIEVFEFCEDATEPAKPNHVLLATKAREVTTGIHICHFCHKRPQKHRSGGEPQARRAEATGRSPFP
jgi:hypothetical protein